MNRHDPQSIYDTVAAHLYAQGCRSMHQTKSGCAYRGVGGLKCAVGVLIPDSDYRQWMDNDGDDLIGMGICRILRGMPDRRVPRFATWMIPHATLLRSLQAAHDKPEHWKGKMQRMPAALRAVAKAHGLRPYAGMPR